MADVKITVIKKMDNKQLFGENPPLEFTGIGVCDRFEEGQDFSAKRGLTLKKKALSKYSPAS
jgi:hypothetical protein